jgi:putative ABC transport system substrate-binding protein
MKAKFAVSVAATIVLAFFCSANAQQTIKTVPRVGFISSTGTAERPSRLFEAFHQGLRDLDYVDGKNIAIVHRYAEGRLDRMPPFVHEFVQQKVDVIVGVNNVVIRAAKKATNTIPIVMISSVDPVAAGYVESFARPGGNITGLSWLSRDLSAKRLELLKDVLPKLTRAAVLWDGDGPGPAVAFKEYMAAAQAFKVGLQSLEVRGPDPDFAGAFEIARIARAEALIVVGNPLMSQNLRTIFALATKHRLPSMTEEDRYVIAGGLMSYGANLPSSFRRAATYVDAILKGAKPANLLVAQPQEFEIFINRKTAQQLGIEIPTRVLIRANELIE